MSSLSIIARFPLGVFQGHKQDGSSDLLPDNARLFSALVNAAGQGELAAEHNGQLRITPAVESALKWIEANPPTGLTIPRHTPVCDKGRPDAFPEQGTAEKRGKVLGTKKAKAVRSTGTALAGAFGWTWKDVPNNIARILEQLCQDVSCLGEADSPVVLTVESVEVTHQLNAEASQLNARGLAIRSPQIGRFNALEQAWNEAYPKKHPSSAQDKVKDNERALGSPVPAECLHTLYYLPIVQEPSVIPWPSAYLVPVSAPIQPAQAIAWCVAAHHWLTAMIHTTAPASITGRYAVSVRPPANRVGIQYLPARWLAHLPTADQYPHGALAFLLPRDLEARDAMLIKSQLQSPNKTIWHRNAQSKIFLGSAELIDLEYFWPPVPEGWVRAWTSPMGLVHETRRQSEDPELGTWGFAQAALLSIAHLFRDQLPEVGRRDYWVQVRGAMDAGARVISTRRIANSSINEYIHKVPQALGPVQPYTATIDLGLLTNNRTLLALGQSRHLGGGLLVPVDSPEPL